MNCHFVPGLDIVRHADIGKKKATYKFALHRGVIEIYQEYQHPVHEYGGRILLPLGLLMEKWFH